MYKQPRAVKRFHDWVEGTQWILSKMSSLPINYALKDLFRYPSDFSREIFVSTGFNFTFNLKSSLTVNPDSGKVLSSWSPLKAFVFPFDFHSLSLNEFWSLDSTHIPFTPCSNLKSNWISLQSVPSRWKFSRHNRNKSCRFASWNSTDAARGEKRKLFSLGRNFPVSLSLEVCLPRKAHGRFLSPLYLHTKKFEH